MLIKKVLVASNNNHKIKEISEMLKSFSGLSLCSLKDFGISHDVIEDGKSLEENAFIKAKQYYSILNIPVLSDDTGLFVDALNGKPGIYSARYAGEGASYNDNCNKLLSEMTGIDEPNKAAGFECVICFYVNEKEYYFFKGACKGKIIKERRGENGFGYDPIFVPDGYSKSFAELTDTEKNKISHRAVALQNFTDFIASYSQ